MQKIGKYSIITTGEFNPSEADVVILDSNVLIDIDKFYYKGASVQTRNNIRDILYEFRKVDEVDYRYALMETCFKRTGCEANHATRMMNAIMSLWIDDMDEIDKKLSCECATMGEGDVGWEKLPTESEIANSVKLPNNLYIMYGTILHLLMIYEQSGRDRGEAYSVHCRWIRDELGCISAYPRMVARSLLLGQAEEHSRARSLLKVDKKNITIEDKAWNAAWDCFFMLVLDGYRMGEEGVVGEGWVDQSARAVLVTARDQVWIDSMSSFWGYVTHGENRLPFLGHTLHVKEDYLEIARIEEKLDQEHHQKILDNSIEMQNIIEKIVELEREIGVSIRTTFDIE